MKVARSDAAHILGKKNVMPANSVSNQFLTDSGTTPIREGTVTEAE